MKKTLIIGRIPEAERVYFDSDDVSIVGTGANDTLKWCDILLKRDDYVDRFDTVIVITSSTFFRIGGECVTPKINSIVSALKDTGKIWIRQNRGDAPRRLGDILVERGFHKKDSPVISYSAYSKTKAKDVSTQEGKDLKEPDEQLAKYVKRDYSITSFRLGSKPKKETISFEQFEQEVLNPDFISRFVNSQRGFLEYKQKFYFERLQEVTQDFDGVQKKVVGLRKRRIGDRTIREMYPMFDFYAGFIFDLEELLERVNNKLLELSPEKTQQDLLDALNNETRGFASIIGRKDIKEQIVSHLYAFSRSYKLFVNTFSNMAFIGNSGVGKTILAKVVGYVFAKSGILATNKVKIVSRADFIGQYIGHTAPRTRSLLIECLEGVLFIDEAHKLTPTSDKDYAGESLSEIVNFLDKYIGLGVVIVAGYNGPMKKFFDSDEGLRRRFPHQYHLNSYSEKELADILILSIERKSDLKIDDKTANFLFTVLVELSKENPQVLTYQGGDMLNLASIIVRTIYSSYGLEWEPDAFEHNLPLLLVAINEFLDLKGSGLSE